MRQVFLSLICSVFLMFGSGFNVAAQQSEIQDTISNQIEAFKVDDFVEAFRYATPQLQQLFQSPQNFQRMVTQGYPMVWRPAELRYLDLSERDGALWQKVEIVDAEGRLHLLAYRMEQTPEGWRIAGVQFLKAPAASV